MHNFVTMRAVILQNKDAKFNDDVLHINNIYGCGL